MAAQFTDGINRMFSWSFTEELMEKRSDIGGSVPYCVCGELFLRKESEDTDTTSDLPEMSC